MIQERGHGGSAKVAVVAMVVVGTWPVESQWGLLLGWVWGTESRTPEQLPM